MEQLGLHGKAQFGNLIKKQGSPVSSAQKPLPVALRSGEGPFHISEKFAFQQLLRNGRAVDHDKGLIAPRADIVYDAGQHAFARAGFSQNDEAGVGLSHLQGQIHGLAHGRSPAEKDFILPADFCQQLRVFPLQTGAFALQFLFFAHGVRHVKDGTDQGCFLSPWEDGGAAFHIPDFPLDVVLPAVDLAGGQTFMVVGVQLEKAFPVGFVDEQSRWHADYFVGRVVTCQPGICCVGGDDFLPDDQRNRQGKLVDEGLDDGGVGDELGKVRHLEHLICSGKPCPGVAEQARLRPYGGFSLKFAFNAQDTGCPALCVAYQRGGAVSAGLRALPGEQEIGQQWTRGKIEGSPMISGMQNLRSGNAGNALAGGVP